MSMSIAKKILADLNQKKYNKIYFLMGEEAYIIETISNFIEKNVLSEEEKVFNQFVLYGTSIDIDTVIALTKRYPIMSRYTVIILKEAQFLSESLDKLYEYINKPFNGTLLVVCFNNKIIDNRQKLYKVITSHGGVLFNSKKYSKSEIFLWLEERLIEMVRSMDDFTKCVLVELVGDSLIMLSNALQKIHISLPEGTKIMPEDIYRYVGISPSFNIFEWQKAIAYKNFLKAHKMAFFFVKNSNTYTIPLLLDIIYNFFTKLILYINSNNTIISQYFDLKTYEQALRSNYSLYKIFSIINFILEADNKIKVLTGYKMNEFSILEELLCKIFLN